jgi:hypothetical protein
MKSLLNKILCTELYILIVYLFPIKSFLRFASLKKRMINIGYLRISDGKMDLSRFHNLLCQTIAPLHFYSKILFFGIGILPLGMYVSKILLSSMGIYWIVISSLLLSFGIPWIVIWYLVIRNEIWMEYWEQVLLMNPNERKRLVYSACVLFILFTSLFCAIYFFFIPSVRNL